MIYPDWVLYNGGTPQDLDDPIYNVYWVLGKFPTQKEFHIHEMTYNSYMGKWYIRTDIVRDDYQFIAIAPKEHPSIPVDIIEYDNVHKEEIDKKRKITITPMSYEGDEWYEASVEEWGDSCYGRGSTPIEALLSFELEKREFIKLLNREKKDKSL